MNRALVKVLFAVLVIAAQTQFMRSCNELQETLNGGRSIVNGRLVQLCNSLAHLLEGICNLTLGDAKPLGQFHRRGQSSIY